MLDIKKVKEDAEEQVREERTAKAQAMLVNQMRVVETAKQVLANEQRRLADIETAIADGNIK